jgi:DNA replication protein DnaC
VRDNAPYADETLSELKLTGMATALSAQMEQPGTYEELSFKGRLALLVARESLEREQRKQKRLLQKTRLRLEAPVHDIDYQPARMGTARTEPADNWPLLVAVKPTLAVRWVTRGPLGKRIYAKPVF